MFENLVLPAISEDGKPLCEAIHTLEELQQFSPLIENDVFAVLTVEGSLASRNHIGGTAPAQVRAAIERARKRLD